MENTWFSLLPFPLGERKEKETDTYYDWEFGRLDLFGAGEGEKRDSLLISATIVSD